MNVQLVRVGAAASYFYAGRRGRYAALLEDFQKQFLSRLLTEQMALAEATPEEAAAIAYAYGYSAAALSVAQ